MEHRMESSVMLPACRFKAKSCDTCKRPDLTHGTRAGRNTEKYSADNLRKQGYSAEIPYVNRG